MQLDERGAQGFRERPRGVEARHPDVRVAQERLARVLGHPRGDDDRELGADRLLLVLELAQPRRLPGLGLLRFPEDRAAARPRGRAHALDEVGAVHALGHRHDVVEREGGLQQRFERELERLALELLRALLELALQVRGLALRRVELRLPLRLAAAELLAGGRARLALDALSLRVELALVVDVPVLLRLLQLAELAAQLELLAAELRQRAFLGSHGLLHRLQPGLVLGLGAALRLGRKLRLELAPALGEAALELLGMALDRLPGDAFGQREVVAALRASHLLFGFDDDGAGHSSLLIEIRGPKKSVSDTEFLKPPQSPLDEPRARRPPARRRRRLRR